MQCPQQKCNKSTPKRRVSDENEAKAAIGVHKDGNTFMNADTCHLYRLEWSLLLTLHKN